MKPLRLSSRILYLQGLIFFALALICFFYVLNSYIKNNNMYEEQSLQISSYEPIKKFTSIENSYGLSGITFSSATNTLFVIQNAPTEIFEISLDGELLRKISLVGFFDTEDISYIKDDKFVIVQERSRTVSTIQITPDTFTISAENSTHVKMEEHIADNFGLEGISWSKQYGLFIANEKNPVSIQKVSNFFPSHEINNPHTNNLFAQKNTLNKAAIPISLSIGDISAIYVSEREASLLVLSDESQSISEISFSGDKLGVLDINPSWLGLNPPIRQPEGLTMDNSGKLYVVGEPAVIWVYEKQNFHPDSHYLADLEQSFKDLFL